MLPYILPLPFTCNGRGMHSFVPTTLHQNGTSRVGNETRVGALVPIMVSFHVLMQLCLNAARTERERT